MADNFRFSMQFNYCNIGRVQEFNSDNPVTIISGDMHIHSENTTQPQGAQPIRGLSYQNDIHLNNSRSEQRNLRYPNENGSIWGNDDTIRRFYNLSSQSTISSNNDNRRRSQTPGGGDRNVSVSNHYQHLDRLGHRDNQQFSQPLSDISRASNEEENYPSSIQIDRASGTASALQESSSCSKRPVQHTVTYFRNPSESTYSFSDSDYSIGSSEGQSVLNTRREPIEIDETNET